MVCGKLVPEVKSEKGLSGQFTALPTKSRYSTPQRDCHPAFVDLARSAGACVATVC